MAALQERPQQITGRPGALEDALAAVARRLRLARWVRHASRGALVAVAVSLVAVACDHFDLLPDWLPLPAVIAAAFALGILVGTITAFLKPLNSMDVARLAEMRLGLKERLSSALDFERAGPAPAASDADIFRRMQQQDARLYAGRLKAAEAAPLHLSWETKALIPALLLLVLALVLPNLAVFVPPGLLVERSIVKKEGQKLERTARVIEKQAEAKNMPVTKRAAQNMQRLAHRMAAGHMDRRQAMVRISQLTKQMQDQQKQLAQQSGLSSLGGGKSLAQAGQQLSAALQGQPAGGQNGQGASKAQGANASGSKSTGSKGGANGGAHPGGLNGSHGFNVPGQNKTGDKNAATSPAPAGAQSQPTPEMQKIAQALQQNNAQTLSDQLRQLAQKAQSGQMTPQQQQQAAQDLQKLANALQGTGMPQTQQHAQAAAQAMAHGDKQSAASEMKKAADAAERESQQQNDQQGMQDAQNSLQDGQGEMAGAQDAGDIPDDGSGQGQQGKGQGKNGQGQGQGQTGPPEYGGEGNGGGGGGRGKPNTTYHKGQKPNHKVHQSPGYGADAPHWLNPNFDPSKNPRYAKLYFGKPKTAGPSQAGPTRKSRPGDNDGPVTSVVPYYNQVAGAKKTAESAMDREDIPPAYKKNVSDYFNSLQPQTPPPPAVNGAGDARP